MKYLEFKERALAKGDLDSAYQAERIRAEMIQAMHEEITMYLDITEDNKKITGTMPACEKVITVEK